MKNVVIDIEKERLEILKRYRKLLRTAKPFLKDDDAKQIKKDDEDFKFKKEIGL